MMIVFLMAGITTGGGALEHSIRVAAGTSRLDVCTGQFEGGRVMVEGGWQPAAGGMASRAILAELAVVVIALCMAGITIGRSALVITVGVATGTSHLGVLACQFERSRIVVEGRWDPGGGCMAGTAIGAELATVLIVLCMAGVAVGWSAPVYIVHMACAAGRLGVAAGQFEGCQIMVKGCRVPATGCMAARAIGSQQAGVRIDPRMTTGAVRWSPLENAIDVATGAGNTGVFTGQFECKQVVVDGCRPSLGIMAKGAIRAILPLVLIVLLVAGIAVGWRTLEDFVDMTTLTGYTHMLSL